MLPRPGFGYAGNVRCVYFSPGVDFEKLVDCAHKRFHHGRNSDISRVRTAVGVTDDSYTAFFVPNAKECLNAAVGVSNNGVGVILTVTMRALPLAIAFSLASRLNPFAASQRYFSCVAVIQR